MTRDGVPLLMLIDDEPAQRRLVAAMAARNGWRTVFASDRESALATLGTLDGMQLDAVLIDHWGDDFSAAPLLTDLRRERPALPILVLTAQHDVDVAVAAMRAGAADFLTKPIAPDRLMAALKAAVKHVADVGELRPLSEKISAPLSFEDIIGSTPSFRTALAIAAKAARSRIPVLIEGENGVGKDVMAQAIHAASPRHKVPMISVNCSGVPANLIDSELFGHERGAFAGAFDRQIGRFQEAQGGTLFLDEVGDLPMDTQVKLLRYLQTGEIQPLGARHAFEVDVRIIAAANRPLLAEVEAGRLREDLYYRLAVVQLTIPPLRERRSDIPALCRHLLARIATQPGLRSLGITEEALRLLVTHPWPGNVRQLQNALFRAAVLCDSDALTTADFPQIAAQIRDGITIAGEEGNTHAEAVGVTLFLPDGHLRPLADIEADVIRLAIGHYRGRMTEVARRLGIGRSTLYRKLSELGIDSIAS